MLARKAAHDGVGEHEDMHMLKALARKASVMVLLSCLLLYPVSAKKKTAKHNEEQSTTSSFTHVPKDFLPHLPAQKPQKRPEAASGASGKHILNGIFVSMDTLDAYEGDPNLGKAMSKISSTGFNVVEVESVNAYGYAFYRSRVVPQKQSYFSNFVEKTDPLKDIIRAASARNIMVWAWVHPFTGNNALYKMHKGWFAVSSSGKTSHRYLDFINPHVRSYTLSMMRELASNYSISGINLDIELPRNMVSYSSKDLKLFAADNGLHDVTVNSVVSGRYNAMWNAWMDNILYNFLAKC